MSTQQTHDISGSKSFATTIGAENWIRANYDGPFPVSVTVVCRTRKGLVNKKYTLPRKPSRDDIMPVGTLS